MKQINQAQKEEGVLKFWQEADIFKKSLEKNREGKSFVFYEGPPTANGQPGIHHVIARSFKDCLPRYKTMKGFKVDRKAGWDTHGLPVELKVEKDLNIKGKPEIEKYGIAEFNQKCRESVWQYKDEWEKLTKRIAFWLDLDNPYITYENDYIESVWYLIKQIYDKGLLYKGHKVVPHCPRCGTSLSSHELAQGYKEVKDRSVYVKFKLLSSSDNVQEGDYVLAWTTTPWTLPGNVALAVGKDINYVRVKYQDEYLILAKERLNDILKDHEILSEFKGEALKDLNYQALFDLSDLWSDDKKAHFIALADFVSTDDGSGVVHTAVMYGEDDYSLADNLNLPKVHSVDEAGKFVEALKKYDLAGAFVKSAKAEEKILNYLKENNYLFKEEDYLHDYPYCWRCDTPLLYYAKDSWLIKMTALREKLIANNNQINWVPAHIKEGRFGEWLSKVKDWSLSRERYWGTPLPIWQCQKCHELKCIGSKKELGADLDDLHRPYIDDIKFTCSCGGEMIRDLSVLDCWFDSGAMPFAQHHFPFSKDNLDNVFPADYICEAIDQTRGWFYTLLAISTLMDKGLAYKNVICLGHINDKEGKKMSKSKGNVIDPWQVINEYGVDAVRQHLYTLNSPGEGKNYDLNDVRDVFRQNIILLNNIYNFYSLYADQEKTGEVDLEESDNILDQWLISRFNHLNSKISNYLENYQVYEAAREIPAFIDDFSTWYLRRSRDRFKGDDLRDKELALLYTRYCLQELSKLMAPFMPFMAEITWQEVCNYNFKDLDKSVHLNLWPKFKEVNQTVLEEMSNVRKLAELGLAARDEHKIKIRQKLAKATIYSPLKQMSDDYLQLLADELNVVEIDWQAEQGENRVILDTNITEELKLEGFKRDFIRLVNALRKEAGLSIEDKTSIIWQGDKDLEIKINNLSEDIKKGTLSEAIEYLDFSQDKKHKKLNFDDKIILISLK
jgi:isoleucyl-tRNA synthetase